MLQGDVGVTLYYTTNLSMTATYIFFLKQTYLLSTCSRSASRSLILLCSITYTVFQLYNPVQRNNEMRRENSEVSGYHDNA